jgi:RNA polymerase sigma-70 factor, ECF subfamily
LTLLEEQWLLHRLKADDRLAAEKLVEAFYLRVYYFLFSLCHDRLLAQDLTQETFCRFWQNLYKFQNRCRLLTWLFRIAWHAWLDEVKKLKTRGEQIPLDQIEDVLAAKEPEADVGQMLQQLPLEQAEVLRLFYLQDLTLKQIAAILEIPIGTVKSRLHQAKAKLNKSELSGGHRYARKK